MVFRSWTTRKPKKKNEQIDSHHKSPETTPNPNGVDDPDLKEVTYKSMRGMMIKVLFDVLSKVFPQAVVKDVLPNEVTEKKYF